MTQPLQPRHASDPTRSVPGGESSGTSAAAVPDFKRSVPMRSPKRPVPGSATATLITLWNLWAGARSGQPFRPFRGSCPRAVVNQPHRLSTARQFPRRRLATQPSSALTRKTHPKVSSPSVSTSRQRPCLPPLSPILLARCLTLLRDLTPDTATPSHVRLFQL